MSKQISDVIDEESMIDYLKSRLSIKIESRFKAMNDKMIKVKLVYHNKNGREVVISQDECQLAHNPW